MALADPSASGGGGGHPPHIEQEQGLRCGQGGGDAGAQEGRCEKWLNLFQAISEVACVD